MKLSPAQEVLFATYSNGDFAHFAAFATQQEFDGALASCGDGLFRFLAVELALTEDCDTLQEGAHRTRAAVRDLESLFDRLCNALQVADKANPPGGVAAQQPEAAQAGGETGGEAAADGAPERDPAPRPRG